MIPLVLYLSTPPTPGLLLSYTDFRLELAERLGYGADSDWWETSFPGSTAELHRLVNQAYRWCLYPHTLPDERVTHVWTFLQRDGSLTFAADDYQYDTPTDFASFVGEEMWWSSPSASSQRMRRVDVDTIRRKRQYFQSSTAYPQLFAIDWNYPSVGQAQTAKIIVHPTPSAASTVNYRYAFNPDALSTTNPYPLGGQRMSQLVLEASAALGEFKKNGSRGDSWGVFREQLDSTIRMDKHTQTTTTVGMMRGSDRLRFADPYLGESQYYERSGVDGFVLLEGA